MADIPVRVIINAINNASKEFKTMSNDAGRFASDINRVAVAGTALGATAGLLTREFINQAGAMEQNQVAFRTMIGNAETADNLLNNIRDFAKRTPFNLNELVEGSKRLLAYNIEAKDLIPTLGVLGDITAGVGRDKLPQLILAFGQVKAATKLTGAELRQFSEAGVPLLDTLAKQFGVSASEIQDLVSDGKIGFKDVEKALTTLTSEGGKFHDLMQSQSLTTTGKISNMEDSFQQLEVTLGKALLPTVNRLLEAIIPMVEKFGQWAEKNPDLIVQLTGVSIAVGGISSAILVLQPIVKTISAAFSILSAVFGLLGVSAAGALNAVFAIGAFLLANPITLVILAIAAAMGALALAWKNNWGDIQGKTKSVMSFVGGAISSLIETVTSLGENATESIRKFTVDIISYFQNLPNEISTIWNGITLTISEAITNIVATVAAMPAQLSAMVEAFKTSIYVFFTETLPYAIGFVVGRMERWVMEDVPNAINALIQFLTETIPLLAEQFTIWFTDMLVQSFNAFYNWATVEVPNAITALVGWLQETIPLLVAQFISWITNLATQSYAKLIEFKNNAISSFIAFKDGAIEQAKITATNVIEWVKTLVRDVTTVINQLPGNIVAAMQRVKDAAISKAREIYDGVKEWFDKIAGFFGEIISKASEAIGKAREAFNIGQNAGKNRQFGGPVSAATAYTVGEVGPEGFTPQVAGHITPNGQYAPIAEKGGGGSTIQFIINADTIVNSPLERRSFAEAIYKDLVVLARSQNTSVAELFGA